MGSIYPLWDDPFPDSYETVNVHEVKDNDIDNDVVRTLNVSHEKIIHGTQDLDEGLHRLTSDKKCAHEYV